MKAPVLHTTRLTIGSLQILDAAEMFRYRADARVTRYQSWHPQSEQEVTVFIEKHAWQGGLRPGSWYQMGVYLRQHHELIGDIGIHFLDEGTRSVEIGYTIAPDRQRKGFAGEAVAAVVAFLFRSLQVARIIAVVDAENTASLALLSKLGFVKTTQNSIVSLIEKLPDDVVFYLAMEHRG